MRTAKSKSQGRKENNFKIDDEVKRGMDYDSGRGPGHNSERNAVMGETLTGVEAIAKHYSVTNRMVWSWFARGMPNEITLEGSHMIFISAADEWLENNFKLLFDGNYQVQIQCDKKVIWSHGEKGGFPYGMTNRSYHQDGTMGQIAAALKRALGQCGYHVETTPHDGSIKKLPVN